MERISIFNYEAFYLDFLEGNLNEADTLVLMNFLEENPELKVDMDDSIPVFSEENVLLDDFSKLLLKTEDTETVITGENVDYFIIAQAEGLLEVLKDRFEKNTNRHEGLEWEHVAVKLVSQSDKLWSLNEMEISGGEPDVIGFDEKSDCFIFCDCAEESPNGRRSFCYDLEALNSRKEHKPKNNAIDVAKEMRIELLTEEQYRALQKLGDFDKKTSSWLQTPNELRKLGGAIFGDFRYNTTFIYHNGAESYYAARGFRGLLKV